MYIIYKNYFSVVNNKVDLTEKIKQLHKLVGYLFIYEIFLFHKYLPYNLLL